MDYTIQEREQFKLIGFVMEVPEDEGFNKCPVFWQNIGKEYFSKLNDGSEISKAIKENNIGEFGLCITRNHMLYYMIAGIYQGGNVPEGLRVKELDYKQYLSFKSEGTIPEGLQQLIHEVYHNFIPAHKEFNIDDEVMLEWYRMENADSPLKAGLWLPIK